MGSASNSGDVHIVLEASVSRRGKQDALRQGVRPTDRIAHTVDPRHPMWQRVVALDPEVEGSDVRLTLNRSWEVSIVNETWETERLTSDPVLGWTVWRYPDVEIRWGEAQPLDEWLSIEQLIEMEEQNRAAVQRAVTEMQHEVDRDVRPSWRQWMRGFVEECRKRHDEWVLHEGIGGPDKLSRQQNLARLRDAVEAFDPNTHDVAERTDELYSLFFQVDRQIDAAIRSIETAKRRRELVTEAAAWATDYGSTRLHKALAANLIDCSLGVYRDERLAREHPGWSWLDHDTASSLKNINNPSEVALDALLEAREWDAGAQLRWLTGREGGVAVVLGTFLDRPICYFANTALPPEYRHSGGRAGTDGATK